MQFTVTLIKRVRRSGRILERVGVEESERININNSFEEVEG